jgi:flavodoxin
MKTLIVFKSIHHGNSEKIAIVIGKQLKATVTSVEKVDPNKINKYSMIGFGSGIYFGKLHQEILDFATKLPDKFPKKVFIFSTSGSGGTYGHRKLKNILAEKNSILVGEFECKALDTWGPFKMVGGFNKGRPNVQDLKDARKFAKSLSKKR